MGCLRQVLKGTAILLAIVAAAGYFIYHTNWFQKKYLYPLPYAEEVLAAAQESEVQYTYTTPHEVWAYN